MKEELICGNCGSTEHVVENVRVYANKFINFKSDLYYKFYDSEDALMCVKCSLSNIMTTKQYTIQKMKKVSEEADAAMKRYNQKLKRSKYYGKNKRIH